MRNSVANPPGRSLRTAESTLALRYEAPAGGRSAGRKLGSSVTPVTRDSEMVPQPIGIARNGLGMAFPRRLYAALSFRGGKGLGLSSLRTARRRLSIAGASLASA
jgi:hypothetical protein